MLVITLKGAENQVYKICKQQFETHYRAGNLNVVGVNPHLAMFYQLLSVKDDDEMIIALPDTMDTPTKNQIQNQIEKSWATVRLNRNTIHKMSTDWPWNALENRDRFLVSPAVHEMPMIPDTDTALIVGNGPSVNDFDWESVGSNVAVFSCWHAYHKLEGLKKVDYLCHLDPFGDLLKGRSDGFRIAEVPCDTKIVATPTVHPDFLRIHSKQQMYGMYSTENPIHSWFALKKGCIEHHEVSGTVTYCEILAAKYAGYKKIQLIGVDLGDPNPSGYWFTSGTGHTKSIVNQHGVEVYIDSTLELFHGCFESLFKEFPDIEFRNLSKVGVDFVGAPGL
jgi:hypothetical protein